jgi:diguanylate cyclase (GGDEF)-like protein
MPHPASHPAEVNHPDSVLARLRAHLPRGGSLPIEEWHRRHAGIVALLWANVVAVPIYSLLNGHVSSVHSIEGGLGLGVLAALAGARRLSPKLRSACASLGLLSAAALLVHASGGLIEMHFYFFVVIIVLTLYEDWMPFLLAVAFVLIHHGVLGTLEPHAVFDRPEEWADPWKWAAIHAAFVAAAGVAALAAWRLNEDVRARMRDAHRQLELASTTDSLTGLKNRRRLMADLASASESRDPTVLVLLDLDGFKDYNDTFGHHAGDSLLQRLGTRLQTEVGDQGEVYRLGGDEFCVIWSVTPSGRPKAEAVSAAALCDRGEGFTVTAAYGGVCIPSEAASPEAALRAADLRMYTNKQASRPSSSAQSRDVLLQALAELRPDLETHVDAVAVLAEALAADLDLPAHAIEHTRFAAQLHDIGKIAIPEAILTKPGALDEQEWSFVCRHTVVGERIVRAAPALAEAASLIRATHENYDGSGYPDGLRGDAIPLGARIVAVCDAFDAMTSDRPYRLAMTPQDAIAELTRCAGTQFDPAIVAAFTEVLRRPARDPDGTHAASRA